MNYSDPTKLGILACPGGEAFAESVARKLSSIYRRRFDRKSAVLGERYHISKDLVTRKINFDFDMYTIREDMKPVMQANANWLLKFASVEVLVEGHCDEKGTIEYNIALGEKRAEAARNYLVSLGLNAAKVKIISYGKSKPLVQGVDEATYFQNRRAEFVITKK